MPQDSMTAPAENETASTSRKAVSKRIILSADATPQDDWLGAAGVRYESLAAGKGVDVMFADLPDEVQNGLMAFGALTLAGNVTNTVRNSEEGKALSDAERGQAEIDTLLAWLDNLKSGNWTSPRGEVEAGTELLALGYALAMRKAGKEMTDDEAREKVKAADKAKRKAVKSDPRVAAAIAEIVLERKRAKLAESAGELPLL